MGSEEVHDNIQRSVTVANAIWHNYKHKSWHVSPAWLTPLSAALSEKHKERYNPVDVARVETEPAYVARFVSARNSQRTEVQLSNNTA
jgi:hypothetical protein